MNRALPICVALLLALAGCAGSESDAASPPKTATSAAPSPTETTPPPPTSSSDLVVSPGAIGPVEAGVSKDEAISTGLFNSDVQGVEGCTFPLQWKSQFEGVDVATLEDGSVASLGVTAGGPKTSEGVGVGSTLAEVSAAYPNLSPVVEVGFGQAGAFEANGEDYIGFLFGEATAADIKQKSKVTFIEVTRGDKPGLMRSGC